jgi:hypothetical protein
MLTLLVWDSNPSIEIYNTAPNGTPIAAASSYTNVTAGYETWRHMLKLSKEGVQVSTWLGGQNGVRSSLLLPFPPVLSLNFNSWEQSSNRLTHSNSGSDPTTNTRLSRTRPKQMSKHTVPLQSLPLVEHLQLLSSLLETFPFSRIG